MEGIIIIYKPKDSAARTMLHQILYGRMSYKIARGHKVGYYTPGMLHDIQFRRLVDSKVFIVAPESDTDKYKYNLEFFGDISIEYGTRDVETTTGKQFWKNIALERECIFKQRERRRRK